MGGVLALKFSSEVRSPLEVEVEVVDEMNGAMLMSESESQSHSSVDDELPICHDDDEEANNDGEAAISK